jgi:citrate lyase beta subunit
MNVVINLEDHTILIIHAVNVIALPKLEVVVMMDSAQIPFQHKIAQIRMDSLVLIHALIETTKIVVEVVVMKPVTHVIIYYPIKLNVLGHKIYSLLFHVS